MRSISYHLHVDSPFSVLGLDSDADDEEVVEAYRRRIKEAHPDHGGSHREFQRVRAAYQAIQSGDLGGEEDEKATDEERVEERDRTPKHPMVEFLNYEVIDDYDWNVDDDGLFDKAVIQSGPGVTSGKPAEAAAYAGTILDAAGVETVEQLRAFARLKQQSFVKVLKEV